MSLAIERHQRLTTYIDGSADVDCHFAVGVMYCLSLSNASDSDVSSAVLRKLQTNEHGYPADEFRGRFRCLYP